MCHCKHSMKHYKVNELIAYLPGLNSTDNEYSA